MKSLDCVGRNVQDTVLTLGSSRDRHCYSTYLILRNVNTKFQVSFYKIVNIKKFINI